MKESALACRLVWRWGWQTAFAAFVIGSLPLSAQPDLRLPTQQNPAVARGASVKPLDLSRSPTADDLRAAGQLGGALHPTHELNDGVRSAAARWDFGRAIEQWNKHEYPKAVTMFRKHVKDFPDSPWAAEAILHAGCDATYNGRYTEAESIFRQLIADHQGKDHDGARMMLGKARQRLGLFKGSASETVEARVG